MPDLNNLIQSVLAGGNLDAISQHLGTSNEETAAGVAATLPTLLGALAGNASTPHGEQSLASALEQHHDGSVLDSIGGLLSGSLGGPATNGAGILGHLLGDNNEQTHVVNSLAGKSGVSPTLIAKLMPLLAPMVMGWLGKQMMGGGSRSAAAQSGSGMGGGGMGGGPLGGLLGGVLGQVMGGGASGGGGGLADMLGGLLGGGGMGGQQQQQQQQQKPAASGIDLGSILGSVFGK